MHICAGANPDSLNARVCEHVLIVLIYSNTKLLVFCIVPCPFKLVWEVCAYSHHFCARSSINQSVDVSLSHASKAHDADRDSLDSHDRDLRDTPNFCEIKMNEISRFR